MNATERLAALERSVQRLGTGHLNGQSPVPQRIPERQRTSPWRPDREVQVWSSNGQVVVTAESDLYEVVVGGFSIEFVVLLSGALAGDTTVLLKVNGATVATATVLSGATRGSEFVTATTMPGDVLTIETTTAGTGTARASAQAHIR